MFDCKMNLTDEQLNILNGSMGATMAKVMETLIMFGEVFGATELIEMTHFNGHLNISMGMGAFSPLYTMMDKIINDEIKTKDYFTVNPRPLDYSNVKCSVLEKRVFNKILYSKQGLYEEQLKKVGIKDNNAYTCINFVDEVGNKPKYGDILAWGESSSVIYANSVVGARTNRNSSMIELFCNILGLVPNYGLLLDENRKASVRFTLRTSKLPDPQLLGHLVATFIKDEVVYISGLDKHLGKELTDKVKSYLKDFGSSLASETDCSLFHIDNLTPEAKKYGTKLMNSDYITIVIDEDALVKAYDNIPISWANRNDEAQMCFIGCPHLTLGQLNEWSKRILDALHNNDRKKVVMRVILTTAPDVLDIFNKTQAYDDLVEAGVKVSCICPMMYTNNPLTHKRTIITNSNKLRINSSSRYYTSEDILDMITRKDEK